MKVCDYCGATFNHQGAKLWEKCPQCRTGIIWKDNEDDKELTLDDEYEVY